MGRLSSTRYESDDAPGISEVTGPTLATVSHDNHLNDNACREHVVIPNNTRLMIPKIFVGMHIDLNSCIDFDLSNIFGRVR